MELVELKNEEAVCTSLDIAESFGKNHKHVLEKINQIIENDSTENSAQCFRKSSYKDDSGKSNVMYYMNRDGFTFLVMGFTGNKANEWKWKYIEAFNKMEKILSEKQTNLWIETRYQGKLTRNAETSIIQKLVEYAKEQGSAHADMLYVTYTKLANKMSGITNGRELATATQLSKLTFIENIILNQIRMDMERDTDYHDIYKNCKRQIELFKDIAYLETIG